MWKNEVRCDIPCHFAIIQAENMPSLVKKKMKKKKMMMTTIMMMMRGYDMSVNVGVAVALGKLSTFKAQATCITCKIPTVLLCCFVDITDYNVPVNY